MRTLSGTPTALAAIAEDVTPNEKCLSCAIEFLGHDAVLDHLEQTPNCKERYKEEGKSYCVICDKHFESVSFQKMKLFKKLIFFEKMKVKKMEFFKKKMKVFKKNERLKNGIFKKKIKRLKKMEFGKT